MTTDREKGNVAMLRGPLDRRNLLTGGGAAALGLLGAGTLGIATASPAMAVGSSYNPVEPYRSIDTRYDADSKLRADYYVDLDVWTDRYGVGKIPSNSLAVTFNLTVTQTEASGWLLVWPAGGSEPAVSTINWMTSGVTLANGGTVRIGTSAYSGAGSMSIGCGGGTTTKTHFIVDITGYYL